MDYQAVLLIGAIVVGLVVAVKNQIWTVPVAGRRGNEYQRVISAAIFGLFLFVSGLIGWDLSYSHEWFQGTKWVDGLVWWQVGLGAGLLLLAGFWVRRVPSRPLPR
jgi:hypothetical protein